MMYTKNKNLLHRSGKSALVLLFCLLCTQLCAQRSGKAVSAALPHGLDWRAVEAEYTRLLNGLRDEKKRSQLKDRTPVLDTAAFDQAAYMLKRRGLTHQQRGRKKATPMKRVYYYGGSYSIVGENCIMIFIDTPMQTKYSRQPVTASTEKEIAKALFLGWKNSHDHYKNMIEPQYRETGLGYAYDEKSHQLYCAQVFGGEVQKGR